VRNCGDGSFEDLYTAVDITERKTAEEKLRMTEVLFNLARQMSKVGVWIVELPDRAMHWTEQVHQILDLPSDHEPTLAATLEFHAPECRGTFREAFEACARDGTPYDLELEMITATGRRIRVRTLGQAEIREGRPQRVFGAIQEISAVKNDLQAASPQLPAPDPGVG
jgi:PAS domain-containing protein